MSIISFSRARWALTASIAGLLTSCAAGPTPLPNPLPDPGSSGGASPSYDTPFATSGLARFDEWREDFASRARASGRDPAIVHALLEGLEPLESWLGDASEAVSTARVGISDQAEFAKPIWEYLRTAVSPSRKTTGAANIAQDEALFASIESRYGVDAEAIAAIWGMETNFGTFPLQFDAAEALANMAVEGRRQSYAEGELIALMKMLERGDATRSDLLAGWAGAMGQTQFMPSTYLTYAVDLDGDGKKDVWNNKGDALASAANYLSVSGYRKDQPWGIEVTVHESFDFSLADGQDRRLSTWVQAGLRPMNSETFETGGAEYAELWLPAGATGPKYLLFGNFDVFKTYNRADSYALAVGLLTDAIAGKPGPVTPWPAQLKRLSVAEIKSMQASLNTLGFDAGPVDGVAGRGTRRALQRFQVSRGYVADGYPTEDMLSHVTRAATPQASFIPAPG